MPRSWIKTLAAACVIAGAAPTAAQTVEALDRIVDASAKPAEGMGLGNVRSRAAALGGKVQVDSSPGKGTTVSVECPVVE